MEGNVVGTQEMCAVTCDLAGGGIALVLVICNFSSKWYKILNKTLPVSSIVDHLALPLILLWDRYRTTNHRNGLESTKHIVPHPLRGEHNVQGLFVANRADWAPEDCQ